MANRVLAMMSAVFNFAIKEDRVPEDFVNPCRKLDPPGEEKSRERVLSDDEIKKLWQELYNRAEPTASIYRLILLTAQRGGEVKALRWNQIRGDLWHLPAEITKNHRSHKVPLPQQALSIIEGLRQFSGGSEYVFTSKSKKEGHIDWLGKTSQRIQKAVGFHFTPHDLRRTAATNMSKLGTDDVIIAKILNHSWADRQVTSVYNRWNKLPEMRQALERWGARLDAIILGQPAKVARMS